MAEAYNISIGEESCDHSGSWDRLPGTRSGVADAGRDVEVALTGVFKLLGKAVPLQITSGPPLWFGPDSGNIVAARSAGLHPVGVCLKFAATNISISRVRLNRVAVTAVMGG